MTTAIPAPVDPAYRKTLDAQAHAADPDASAWVAANAGAGKTQVLTNRVLRLMLAGTPPERILCLTFTKAAAAEMSQRIFRRLAEWVTTDGQRLERALRDLIGRAPTPDEQARARQLFASAIETPGGLKVQTIHAFCERVLQRFPLEAGVPPGFTILDEETTRALRREAIEDVLGEAGADRDGPIGQALVTAAAHAMDDRFDKVVADALDGLDWLRNLVRHAPDADDPMGFAAEHYRELLGVRPGIDGAAIAAQQAGLLSPSDLERALTALSAGSTTDRQGAARLAAVKAAATPARRAEALKPFFCTAKGELRARLINGPASRAAPGVEDMLMGAQARFAELDEERRTLVMIEATLALLRVTNAVAGRFAALKARRAALDYDDLIEHTGNLLLGRQTADWVLYKLDGGLDHILVDEAQDTSPAQWRIIQRLAEEFFSGAGAREDSARTLFAVGDEKQSIYGFQGAAPHMFAQSGAAFAQAAEHAGRTWRQIALSLSFRTVEPVLAAVDAVFADPGRTPGLSASNAPVRHAAHRRGHAGLVEVWEPEAPDPTPDVDAWALDAERVAASPAVRLADRIATLIATWLDTGERLASTDRAIRAGDILVLVRRRAPFAPAMVAALKARGIPVAGADRMVLNHQLAVADLAALGDVLVLPEDDLALATVLKSPLIGLDDQDLERFAPTRKGSLWTALLAAAPEDDRLAEAAETLKRWRRRADYVPPYEFYAEVLDREGGRKRLLARLGPDAADPIDEFLDLAMRYDDGAPPSLQGFLHWLRDSDLQLKRDMEHGRNEVRVMTVHGAKGLEAPIVFLPDTCSSRSAGANGTILTLPAERGERGGPLLWAVKGSNSLPPVRAARQQIEDRDAHERNRLLYVAMTRARDRLYVCGFDGRQARPRNCWYEQILGGLEPLLEKTADAAGRTVWRLESRQERSPDGGGEAASGAISTVPLPAWARAAAPREQGLTVPITPSRLVPLESDPEGEPIDPPRDPLAEPATAPSAMLGGERRFLRGNLTHALLQHLPGIAPGQWQKMATGFLASRAADLPAAVRREIVSQTLAVLRDPRFAALFGPGSQAEVPLIAEIADPAGKGPPVRIAGQIDRIVVTDREVLILDFKTNRAVPPDADSVPEVYVLQLAAYRMAIQRIHPHSRVRAALLWTEGPGIMELSEAALDAAATRLFTRARPNLDG